MTDLVALIAEVEISDQMGTVETVLIGVYNNASQLIQDKAAADRKWRTRRVNFKEINLVVNRSMIPL